MVINQQVEVRMENYYVVHVHIHIVIVNVIVVVIIIVDHQIIHHIIMVEVVHLLEVVLEVGLEVRLEVVMVDLFPIHVFFVDSLKGVGCLVYAIFRQSTNKMFIEIRGGYHGPGYGYHN